MKKEEAKELIGKRKGWIGIEESGEFSFYRKRPLTAYVYWLGTDEAKDKAAEWLATLHK